MRLAWHCGYPHFRPMFDATGLTRDEYREVQAFAGEEMLPERRADYRAALGAYATAVAAGHCRDLKLSDFLLSWPGEDRDDDGDGDAEDDQEMDGEEIDRQMSKIVGFMSAAENAKQAEQSQQTGGDESAK
jgi:hypothetical protein